MTGAARSMRPGPFPGIQPTRLGAADPKSCQARAATDCSTASRRNRGPVANAGGRRRMGRGGLFSRFVNLWKTEAEREKPVLLAHRPGARKAEALAQPQHGLEPPDRAPGRVESLKASDPRHGLLDPEMVALDPLLEMLG